MEPLGLTPAADAARDGPQSGFCYWRGNHDTQDTPPRAAAVGRVTALACVGVTGAETVPWTWPRRRPPPTQRRLPGRSKPTRITSRCSVCDGGTPPLCEPSFVKRGYRRVHTTLTGNLCREIGRSGGTLRHSGMRWLEYRNQNGRRLDFEIDDGRCRQVVYYTRRSIRLCGSVQVVRRGHPAPASR